MKIKNFFCATLASLLSLVACEKEPPVSGIPSLTINPAEISLTEKASTESIKLNASRDWKAVVPEDVDWIVVEPSEGKASAKDQEITISVLANAGYDRQAEVKFTIGSVSRALTVSQSGGKGSADDLVIYANDFDKVEATKTFGTGGSSWPYLDQFEGWKNEKGLGASEVTYTFSGMSVRNNSNSDSNYSDYEGSGKNNMFFGSSPYLAISNIDLKGATDIKLSFGTEKYSQDNGSIFKNEEFHIYLSSDGGKKWVEVKEYIYAGGEKEGRWNIASGTFKLTGVEKLAVAFAADVASSYRMDDVKIEITENAATTVDFSKAEEKDFGAGSNGGSGGTDEPGTGTPSSDAIYSETFASGLGDWTLNNVTMPSTLTYVWSHDATYNCAKASAYANSTNNAAESWLQSPVIDLSGVTTAYLEFEQALNYFTSLATAKEEATVQIREENGTWEVLTIPNYPTSLSWNFQFSGSIDISKYAGKKVQLAFVYKSTATKAGTWEVKNVTIQKEKEVSASFAADKTIVIDNIKTSFAADTHASLKGGFKATTEDVTIAFYQGASTTPAVEPTDMIKVYKSSSLIISSTKKMNAVRLITPGGNYCVLMTAVEPSTLKVSLDKNDNAIRIEGQSNSYNLKASEAQVRILKIEIDYAE